MATGSENREMEKSVFGPVAGGGRGGSPLCAFFFRPCAKNTCEIKGFGTIMPEILSKICEGTTYARFTVFFMLAWMTPPPPLASVLAPLSRLWLQGFTFLIGSIYWSKLL